MIILGIDFGDARTGIAVCDKFEMMATDVGYIAEVAFKKALVAVAAEAEKLKAQLIVVGNPINMDGSRGQRSQKCVAFARELTRLTGVPCVMYDERLTTVSAHRILSENNVRGKKRKVTVDALSARLILEDFMKYKKRMDELGQEIEYVAPPERSVFEPSDGTAEGSDED